MSTQIGAPIRIVALVAVLAALAMGAWTFAVGHKGAGSSSSQAEHAGSVAENPISAAKSVASQLSAHNKATAAGKHDVVRPAKPAPAKHATKHATKPHHAAKATRDLTIKSALRHHRVAVVLVYDPQAEVNALSLGEAQLGAGRAHAGFLRVNVNKQRQVEPFAKTYGVLQVPTLLFFARPGKLVQKLVGFADQDTVAQAAFNAARGLVTTEG